jgi:hypothetical protein
MVATASALRPTRSVLIFEFPRDRFRHTPIFAGMNYTDELILLDVTFIKGWSKEKRLPASK